ncbi:acyltransferase family protein [Maribellus maritimus]|uniref:acyltransferase family protein n=1 Tax=Maribellus maritimus TaxID=2870838 RepID=UPI001EEB25B6|nr:acyltransferase family protein [Maribellus maritimus]MCG6189673.1 acyltransferase family protein [Maribellus maritimus]
MKTEQKPRLWYIDNLRIFLISLVVLHHLAITYGAPGDWYYNETQLDFPAIVPMTWFVATNQSFFMGMFFFISALFILPSLNKKGNKKYIKDRLIRLGVPLVVFFFVLSPLTIFTRNRFIRGEDVSLADYLLHGCGTGFGPLWFVEALLVFTAFYLLFRKISSVKITIDFPGTLVILLVAFLTGLLQFIIRIWLPVGWSLPFTGFQIPFFVQYIVLFVLGIIAYQNNWLESVSLKSGKRWFIFAQILILIVFPPIIYFGGIEKGVDVFTGGFTWQCFSYAVWEQLVGFSLTLGLLGLAKKYFNRQGKVAKQLSGSAYGVFVFHTPVIVSVSAIFLSWETFPIVKFVMLAPLALVLVFCVAFLFRKLPLVKKIL